MIEFNDFNGAIFNIRARSLNNVVYWTSQIIGSILIGFLLDQKKLGRRLRAFSGWGVLFAMVWVVHIWAYFYQKHVAPFVIHVPSAKNIYLGTIPVPLTHQKPGESTSMTMVTSPRSGSTFSVES